MTTVAPEVSSGSNRPNRSNANPTTSAKHYLNASKSGLSWVFTTDHKRIGVIYFVAIVASSLIGGLIAMLLRAEMWTAGTDVVSADMFNRLFSMHGAIMVFLVIIPGIPAVFGNFLLPLMLGSRGLAFPRLSWFSMALFVAGASCCFLSLLDEWFDTGWTFQLPYAATTQGSIGVVLVGLILLGGSFLLTGLNFVATIHSLRPAEMTWSKLPLFVWSLYATAWVQILATPILILTMLGLIAHRNWGLTLFDPAAAGDPLLFQQFFWFYSHPAIYIMILPALGVINEIIAVHCRKPIIGYRYVVGSLLTIAFLSFFVWGQHLIASGQSSRASVIFSLLTLLAAVPPAVQIACWLATLHRGAIAWNTPMVYGVMFLLLFTMGGLSGLFLGALSIGVHLHGTHFEVAHFHYVMMGGVGFAFIAAIHHWWPKITGRTYHETAGVFCSWLLFAGFNLTFFPHFIMGVLGLPRRLYHYPAQFEVYQQAAMIGGVLMGVALAGMACYLLGSLYSERRAPANPWGGTTLEWQCSSPPPVRNFETTPDASETYPFDHWNFSEQEQGFVKD